MSTAIGSPLQTAERTIRNAITWPDGDVAGKLISEFDTSDLPTQRALFAALAGRLMVEEARNIRR
jgi:hypothetical protein